MKQPDAITNSQKDILLFIYRYRFLNRNHIQSLLNHKYHSKINEWLADLVAKQYLLCYRSEHYRTMPSVYSLGFQGRKYLLKHAQEYPIHPPLLDRVWHEKKVSVSFRVRLQFIVEIYFSLCALVKTTDALLKFYTAVDLARMHHLPRQLPDAFFSITEKNGSSKRFFLVLIKLYPFESELIRLVALYFGYYKKQEWQNNNPHPFPEIIFVCEDERSKRFLAMFIKKMLRKERNLSFFLTTKVMMQEKGMCKQVLEKVTID